MHTRGNPRKMTENKEKFLGLKMPTSLDVKNHVANGFLCSRPPLLFNRQATNENAPIGYDILSIDEINSHRNKSKTMTASTGSATSSNHGYRQAARWTNSKTGKSTPFRTINDLDSRKRPLQNGNVDGKPYKLSKTVLPTAQEPIKVDNMEKAAEKIAKTKELERKPQGVPPSKEGNTANNTFSILNNSRNPAFFQHKNQPVSQTPKLSGQKMVAENKIAKPLPSFETLRRSLNKNRLPSLPIKSTDLLSHKIGNGFSKSILVVKGSMAGNVNLEGIFLTRPVGCQMSSQVPGGLRADVPSNNESHKFILVPGNNEQNQALNSLIVSEKVNGGVVDIASASDPLLNCFQDSSNSNLSVKNDMHNGLSHHGVLMKNGASNQIPSNDRILFHSEVEPVKFRTSRGSLSCDNEFLQPYTNASDLESLTSVTSLNCRVLIYLIEFQTLNIFQSKGKDNMCIPMANIVGNRTGLSIVKSPVSNDHLFKNVKSADSPILEGSVGKNRKTEGAAEKHADTRCCSLQLPRLERICETSHMPREVVDRLHNVLSVLSEQYPESLPFLMPVNPILQGVPNYFEIIKKPMDLSTISQKLLAYKYLDPWQFVDDVWLMFDNAWKFNPKKTKIYAYCTKLSELFVTAVDPVMKDIGYCCGQRYKYNPEVVICSANGCCILAYSTYFHYQNFNICKACYSKSTTNCVQMGDQDSKLIRCVKKKDLIRKLNNTQKMEPFIKCINCMRKYHQICVMHLNSISSVYICNKCCAENNIEQIKNHYTSAYLKVTHLSEYMENKVNNYLRRQEAEAGVIRIRVVSNIKRICTAQNSMKEVYEENGRAYQFPYREKFILAFQEVNGSEYCFFALQVQEYGSECPEPNNRRVYISYIDSVNYFHPKILRTSTYHEILLAYIEQKRQLGYKTVHVWSCPPVDGGEYIFYFHPPDQKVPGVRKLAEWYKVLFAKGVERGIVKQYRSIVEDNIASVVQIPYFDGDLWPSLLEEIVQETSEKEKQIANSNDSAEKDIRKKEEKMNSLCSRFLSKYKNTVLTVILEDVDIPQTYDTDCIIESEIASTRDSFIMKEREMLLEFSTLRRARFSTMYLTYELNQERAHKQDKCRFCKTYIACCFCSTCDDFQLCFTCTRNVHHQHELRKIPQPPVKLNLKQGLNSLVEPLDALEHIYYSYQKE